MDCIRVIADTQSNSLFRGSRLEQSYDQRGGLCQVGADDVVITTDPISPEYLDYWKGLGFELPHLIVAGPYHPDMTLSELIMSKFEVQQQIVEHVCGRPTRLEFFWISGAEQELAKTLDIQPYCNFSVVINLARKPVFKHLFDQLGLPTPPWSTCRSLDELYKIGFGLLRQGKSFFVKSEEGTGGIACKGMYLIRCMKDLDQITGDIVFLGDEFIVEELIDSPFTVSIHWEIDFDLQFNFLGLFDQHAQNYGYSGGAWPSDASGATEQVILHELYQVLCPWLIQNRVIGYGTCDILVDLDGKHYWTDLNPRKGALIYVRDMVQRLQQILDPFVSPWSFMHKHVQLPERELPYSFCDILVKLGSLVSTRQESFVVVTNPGVIPYGYTDITAISTASKQKASECLQQALEHLG